MESLNHTLLMTSLAKLRENDRKLSWDPSDAGVFTAELREVPPVPNALRDGNDRLTPLSRAEYEKRHAAELAKPFRGNVPGANFVRDMGGRGPNFDPHDKEAWPVYVKAADDARILLPRQDGSGKHDHLLVLRNQTELANVAMPATRLIIDTNSECRQQDYSSGEMFGAGKRVAYDTGTVSEFKPVAGLPDRAARASAVHTALEAMAGAWQAVFAGLSVGWEELCAICAKGAQLAGSPGCYAASKNLGNAPHRDLDSKPRHCPATSHHPARPRLSACN